MTYVVSVIVMVIKDKIWYETLIDGPNGVMGICMVYKGFNAIKHHHAVAETYFLLRGSGLMFKSGTETVVAAPDVIRIYKDEIHCMTPISDYVLLLYFFERGPFKKIEYTYLSSKL